MKTITVSADMEIKLGDATGQTVLCDAEGRVLGFFSPEPDKPQLSDLQLEPLLSIEETRELQKKYRTGKPLEEILKRWGL